jgi:ATP-dependent DNA helicase RecG
MSRHPEPRPEIAQLEPLFAPLASLSGMNPRVVQKLAKLLGGAGSEPAVLDLLFHLPSGYLRRTTAGAIADLIPGEINTVRATAVSSAFPPRGRKAPIRFVFEDESGTLDAVFFNGERGMLERMIPLNEPRILSGKVDLRDGRFQMTHPEIAAPATQMPFSEYEAIYPLTLGLTQRHLHRALQDALSRVPDAPEWLGRDLLAAHAWPSFREALRVLHQPRSDADIALWPKARERLAFDEILSSQLAIALVRQGNKALRGRPLIGTGQATAAIRAALPFALTTCQETALAEIRADMMAPRRMLRLLQGDVGSGKTAVAALTMATAIEAGTQAALMAPTDVLARQHLETLKPLFEAASIPLGYLSGRETGGVRRKVLAQLQEGSIRALVGTHAIFQDEVAFHDLGLAVVDEQHRFGVGQRLALQQKARRGDADILVMTATPIPRTLLLSQYGDLDVSRLLTKPAGRKPVTTRAIPIDRLDDVTEALRRAFAEGAQAYWVCPAVDTDTAREMAAAEARGAHLRQLFGDRVGVVHGKMRGAAKDAAIAAFAARETSVLVATTVIEVGVNVPNATVMVIENAEMFGLAQLHQLRGRVGRGSAQSSCLLLYKAPLSATAKARLETMRQCEDGFVIAEEDLVLRGGGDILGARQSGDPGFRLAAWPQSAPWIETASTYAEYILNRDASLSTAQGQALRVLLNLFNRRDAVRLLRAG